MTRKITSAGVSFRDSANSRSFRSWSIEKRSEIESPLVFGLGIPDSVACTAYGVYGMRYVIR